MDPPSQPPSHLSLYLLYDPGLLQGMRIPHYEAIFYRWSHYCFVNIVLKITVLHFQILLQESQLAINLLLR